ncbi:hypothetical protein LG299_10670 [Microbacterium lacus]|uniref:hypothetical protein n=1 Tax=Microbacterium lacus TaxID=415217 RepID=UPI00384D943F
MSATPEALPDNQPAASETTAGVSTKHGLWSVALALGAAVVFWVIGFLVAATVTAIFGGMRDPDAQAAAGVASVVVLLLAIALVIAGALLGISSIVRAFTQADRRGRNTAIALGGLGIVLSSAMGWVLLLAIL